MEIRYEGALIITITPELSKAQGEIPPLTLQLLVENALKHNSFSEERPLMMSFSVEEDYIVVSNTLQPIARQVISTGIGQRNIMARYALLSARKPIVEQTDEVYTASITALTTSLSLSMAKSLPQLSEKPESGTGLLDNLLLLLEQMQRSQFRYRERFLLPYRDGYKSVLVRNVNHIYSENRITQLKLTDGTSEVVPLPMDTLEMQLDPDRFFRANRQYIICADCVQYVANYFNGKLIVHLKAYPDAKIVVSREKAAAFKAWMDR